MENHSTSISQRAQDDLFDFAAGQPAQIQQGLDDLGQRERPR
jgi:hypothetical protein